MKPLEGVSVLITRPAAQAQELAGPIEALGGITILMPVTEILPPESFAELDSYLARLAEFDWLVITSVNGVRSVEARLCENRFPAPHDVGCKVAVVGAKTAAAWEKRFGPVDLIPAESVGEEIAPALGDVSGLNILLARADKARKELPSRLIEAGANVKDVVAYRIASPQEAGPVPEQVPNVIALTSSSSVTALYERLKALGHDDWMAKAKLACIGKMTAETVRELGFQVWVMAETPTMEALVEGIAKGMEVAHAR